jgi:WD40 repeat protein
MWITIEPGPNNGSEHLIMATLRRTIRLFVSSTFSDMKAERDVLQADVFPKLRQLCLSNGLRFQPIDLRWGVPQEAGKDNRAMRICLRELKRCQEERPKPNFLILLGERYGSRPLPELIPADLFAQLCSHLPAATQELCVWRDTQPANAKGWYRRDDNAIPPVYELRPRGDDERWLETVEQPLLHALEVAARQIGLAADMHGVAIGTSATEQEIVEGALNVDDARDHVHAFFRSISGLPDDPWPTEFVDVSDDGIRDTVTLSRLDDLKARIEAKIGATNVHRYTVPWSEGGVQPNDLGQFGQDVYAALRDVILGQIAELASTSREAQEEAAHRAFGNERCRGFIARSGPLAEIAACLLGGGSGLLAVFGPPGSGKSALMAEAVRRARETYGEDTVLARFIGATPDSANILPLLGNLVAEIRRRYPAPPPATGEQSRDGEIPVDINRLTVAFHEALSRPTAERPLFVFLDALDQLAPGNGALECHWLPGALHPQVRLIVSAALPSATDATSSVRAAGSPEAFPSTQDPRTVVMAALERRAPEVQQIRLRPLSAADGRALVAQWLADAGRTLQPAQEAAILEAFVHNGTPLWLRVAIGESQRLTSQDPAPNFDADLPGLMRQVLHRLSAENEHGPVLVERALTSIASARHGLAEDEVIDLLSADRDVMADFRRRSPDSPPSDTLPAAVWVRLYGDIGPYLVEHLLQNATLLGFYHRSFLDAAQATFLGTADGRRAAHQRLADLFAARSWSIVPVDEEGRVQRAAAITDPPDARKASELPWHLLRVAETADPAREHSTAWDPLVRVLCDIEFVEAKCRAGLVFELQEDYRNSETTLPEAQAMLRDEQRRAEIIAHWTSNLVEYAQAWSERRDRIDRGERVDETEPVLPSPPAVSRMLTDEEIVMECERIRERPTSIDRLAGFAGFVRGEIYPLTQFGGHAGFALQHAINYEPGGPVHDAARELLPKCHTPLLLRRWSSEATWNPKPAILLKLEGNRYSAVSVSPDGRLAVSGSRGNTLQVWDLESGACLRTLEGHKDQVSSVSMSPDGRRAVSASWDNTLRVWDLRSGACLYTLEGHRDRVQSVSMTPDGRRAVSASWDNKLRIWDAESGAWLRTLDGHTDRVNSVSMTPDGRRAISGSFDKTVRVWDLESGLCEHILEGHPGPVISVSVTLDGQRGLSGSFLDNQLWVWNLESGHRQGTLEVPSRVFFNSEWSVCTTPDRRRAVSGDCDGKLRVWDLETGACLRVLEVSADSVSVTPDGRRGVSGNINMLRVLDLESGRAIKDPKHAVWTSGWSVSCWMPDGRRVLSGGQDGILRLWDAESEACLCTLEGHTDQVWNLEVTRDGRRAVSGSSDGTLRVWDLRSGRCEHILKGHTQEGWNRVYVSVDVTSDGRRAVSASNDGTLRVWDLESGACLRTLEEHTDRVGVSRLTPDGRRVLSGSRDGILRVWDAESGACLRTWKGHTDRVSSMSVTPDGRRAVSGSEDGTLRVWDLENGACLRVLEEHSYYDPMVVVTPDGRHAVSVNDEGTLRFWDLERYVCAAIFFSTKAVGSVVGTRDPVIEGYGLPVEVRNLPSGPAVEPYTSDAAYEGFLRRALERIRREKGPNHEETLAHLTALTVHLERTRRAGEARSLSEERE